ncbi:SHOCT domain-containing protein [Actinoallomurus iriomotensis]|nr:SHOCT domain-containing protein [Actinoallomurus iriomotensis]
MGAWGYGFMTISVVLFWAVLILGVVALVRYLGRSGQRDGTSSARPTPEQLLAERFARGEIDAEEYRERLHTLRPDATPPPRSKAT